MSTPLTLLSTNAEDLAMAEVRRIDPGVRVLADLGPGVLLLESEFTALAAKWREAPPIFVRHICPADVTIALDANAVGALCAVVEKDMLARLAPGVPFSVQTRIFAENFAHKPFDINTPLSEVVGAAAGAPLDVRAPQQVLSVVIADTPHKTVEAFLGVSRTVDNLSDWAGGVRRFAREEGQISRSEFKLLEAFEVFKITLPSRGIALDLGAAPGGWTRILRTMGQYVTAIDPAELDPRVAADRGVRYKRITAETYLASDPDRFDIIVNDMRMDARDSARLMVRYTKYLQPGGLAIMTLKLPEHGRETVLDHTFNILRPAFTIAGARQLFHNRSEITVYLKT